MKEERIIEYILPKRIVDSSSVTNAEILLTDTDCTQIFPFETQICSCAGHIILDFGKDTHFFAKNDTFRPFFERQNTQSHFPTTARTPEP